MVAINLTTFFRIIFFQNMVMLHIIIKGMTNAATCKHIFCSYTHSRPLGWGQRSNIFKEVILHIKLMGMEHRTPCKHIFCLYKKNSTPGVGSKGQNIFFTKSSHVAFKSKTIEHRAPCKHEFCAYSHHQPTDGVKCQNIFFKVVMSHIKLKEIEYRVPCKHIFCPYTHPRSLGWNQVVKTFFSERSHVAYKIKGNGARAPCKHIFFPSTHP